MFHLFLFLQWLLSALDSLSLNVNLTKKWSASQLGPRHDLTSYIRDACLLFITTWSIWLTTLVPGHIRVPLYIRLCSKQVILMIILCLAASCHSRFPFSLVTSCKLYFLAAVARKFPLPIFALKSPNNVRIAYG